MLIKRADFGYMVWLTEEEKDCSKAMQEIQRLKSLGKVVILYSGNQAIIGVLEKLLKENRA